MNRVMNTLLWFLPDTDSHLSDMQLADLFCSELPLLKSWAARRHLAKCAACRVRKQQLEGSRAEHMLEMYRESMDDADITLPEWPRTAFSLQLKLLRRDVPFNKSNSPVHSGWISWPSSSTPVVLTGALAGVVVGVSTFSLLSWQRGPDITANTLLVRAEKWDVPGAAAGPGVAHQTIEIRNSKQTFKRSIYWDVQGKRHPKRAGLSASEEKLRSVFGQAGIDWNQPISASAYQDWHDHQHVRADHIARSGAHLLTLTTTVPNGIVSDESLTVRDTDFHPIKRKVNFRDHETVEIAELDFAILPWNAVDASVFEPEEGIVGHTVVSSPSILPSPHALETPTPEQLDETELSARLILNQHQADSGEQIEIRRLPQAIEVNGLVETDDRKRELIAQLMTVPRLKVSIQSVTHLNENPHPGSETKTTSVEMAMLPDQPSSLEIYLRAHGQTLKSINTSAEQVFTCALTISQESSSISDLKTRFGPDKRMPILTAATLAELLYSHRERLENALRQERALLAEMKVINAPEDLQSTSASRSLTDEASRNLSLARELTQTGVLKPRGAEVIVAEMFTTVDRIARVEDQEYGTSQQAPKTSMNKAGSVQ